MRERAYYIYILANWDSSVIYVGVTNNLLRRVYEHKQKLVKGFTEHYNVDRLVYFEEFSDILLAIEREKQIKSWSRKKKNQLVGSKNKEWQDIYPSLI